MFVYLDTETTGLNGGRGDEIVELSIIDDNGDILIDTLVKPDNKTSWIDAQEIHGISPDDVIDAPSLKSLMPEILRVISGKTVVIYNSGFDIMFFSDETFSNSNVRCCMLEYAEKIGDWNDYRGGYRWHKLSAAASHVNHSWSGDAHRALADTLATRSVWRWLQAEEAKKTRSKVDKVKREIANKKARDAYRTKTEKQEKVFAKSLRKRGATPDVWIKAGTPERQLVLTKHDIFKENKEGEKWVVAGFGYKASRSRNNKEEFLLYRPFK